MEDRRDARRPALWGAQRVFVTGIHHTTFYLELETLELRRGRLNITAVLEVASLHHRQWPRGHGGILGRQAAPEVGALDQGVPFICYQSPERGTEDKCWSLYRKHFIHMDQYKTCINILFTRLSIISRSHIFLGLTVFLLFKLFILFTA